MGTLRSCYRVCVKEAASRSAGRTPGPPLGLLSRRCSADWRRPSGRSGVRSSDVSPASKTPLQTPAYLRKRQSLQEAVIPGPRTRPEDLNEAEVWRLEEQVLEEWLPDTVAALPDGTARQSEPLLALAQDVEAGKTERKLNELLDVVNVARACEDQRKKLLIFTEHRDTLRLPR